MDTMDGLAGITSDSDITMKQFKAEWQIIRYDELSDERSVEWTITNLITQHNALCDYLEERLNFGHPPSYAIGKALETLDKEHWGCTNCGQTVPVGEKHDCPTFKAKLPPNSGGGSGSAAGLIGKGGYDPRYKNGKAPETITLPKPECWEITTANVFDRTKQRGWQKGYEQALKDASKASGITYKLED